ncbi:hypothetical protein AGLY_015106 [Aphis glycines]|uniref:Uncharacterized protein n=1 Tax=Aphis glycines TaxID=307491 RepID=A0A6G0T287_APHGL|nr:hypothetical protein AGLY_015106 [Aphis glycines]
MNFKRLHFKKKCLKVKTKITKNYLHRLLWEMSAVEENNLLNYSGRKMIKHNFVLNMFYLEIPLLDAFKHTIWHSKLCVSYSRNSKSQQFFKKKKRKSIPTHSKNQNFRLNKKLLKEKWGISLFGESLFIIYNTMLSLELYVILKYISENIRLNFDIKKPSVLHDLQQNKAVSRVSNGHAWSIALYIGISGENNFGI